MLDLSLVLTLRSVHERLILIEPLQVWSEEIARWLQYCTADRLNTWYWSTHTHTHTHQERDRTMWQIRFHLNVTQSGSPSICRSSESSLGSCVMSPREVRKSRQSRESVLRVTPRPIRQQLCLLFRILCIQDWYQTSNWNPNFNISIDERKDVGSISGCEGAQMCFQLIFLLLIVAECQVAGSVKGMWSSNVLDDDVVILLFHARMF